MGIKQISKELREKNRAGNEGRNECKRTVSRRIVLPIFKNTSLLILPQGMIVALGLHCSSIRLISKLIGRLKTRRGQNSFTKSNAWSVVSLIPVEPTE